MQFLLDCAGAFSHSVSRSSAGGTRAREAGGRSDDSTTAELSHVAVRRRLPPTGIQPVAGNSGGVPMRQHLMAGVSICAMLAGPAWAADPSPIFADQGPAWTAAKRDD